MTKNALPEWMQASPEELESMALTEERDFLVVTATKAVLVCDTELDVKELMKRLLAERKTIAFYLPA